MLLTAKSALWQTDHWLFSDGQLKKKTPDQNYSITIFKQLKLTLPENPTDFFIPEYKYNEMSISQLYSRAKSAGGQEYTKAWLEFHGRISYIFLGLPLLLLGLPMLLLISERWKRDISLAVPASCCLAFIAWIWWGTFQSMAKASYFSPGMASWSIHFLVGGLGVFLLRRQSK